MITNILGLTFFAVIYYNIIKDTCPPIPRHERIFMELIVISDDKLKIMLSREDMEHYHISGDELDYSKLSTRTVLKSILSDAKDISGFNTDGQPILVQLFTSAHGGCELFITKGEQDDLQTDVPEKKMQKIKRSYRTLFSFSSFYDLISSCRRLLELGSDIDSIAYSDISGKYFLQLIHTDLSPYTRLDKFTFVLEYGKRENCDGFDSYISEYGNWMCKNAISTLGNL